MQKADDFCITKNDTEVISLKSGFSGTLWETSFPGNYYTLAMQQKQWKRR